MTAQALSAYKFAASYGRYLPEKKRRETPEEAFERVIQMHREKYAGIDIEEELQFCLEAMKDGLVLGSQRALQFGGTPILRREARCYNCTTSYCDRPRFFQECLWLLLCGCGTGFSVQTHHVAKLPKLIAPTTHQKKTYVIQDSIEGWSDALGVLLASYGIIGEDMGEFSIETAPGDDTTFVYQPEGSFGDYVGHNVQFDYSRIRDRGASLSTGAGKAPGPAPLKAALDKIRGVLDARVNAVDGTVYLRPIDCYDIVMHASDAVLSGGVRRSATICLFSPDDEEMLNAKVGNWITDNPQRARSNNSAMLLRDEVSWEQFRDIFMKAREQYGEPGFVWADDTEITYNPCLSPDTRIATSLGLVKIKDLADLGLPLEVTRDLRAGKGDVYGKKDLGVAVSQGSPAQMTRKNAQLYKVVTEHGYEVEATANHTFITPEGRKQLKDLQVGDVLPIQSGKGQFGNKGSYGEGLVMGWWTGDGTSTDTCAYVDVWEDDFEVLDIVGDEVKEIMKAEELSDNCRRKSYDVDWQNQTKVGTCEKKRIGGTRLKRYLDRNEVTKDGVPEAVFQGSEDMVRGYLQGLFGADGSVQVSGKSTSTTVSFRLTSTSENLLRDVQTLLANFGIVGRIYLRREAGGYLLPNSDRKLQEYQCQAVYELILSRPNCVRFEEEIGLAGPKSKKLSEILDTRGRDCSRKPERFVTKIKSIEPTRRSDVYCLEQYDTNTVVANSLVIGQCVEIGLYPAITVKEFAELEGLDTSDMEQDELNNKMSGFSFCNLTEINAKACKTEDDWARACTASAILGTLQAGYTNFTYLGNISSAIAKREALLGCSMTGMMDNPEMAFDPVKQQERAKLILEVNERMAKKIGIRPAARATCTKPAGSTSCLFQTASGIHAQHAKRYFRRSQANALEAPAQFFKIMNPSAVEKSVWNPNGTDLVLTFCIEADDGALTRHEVNGLKQLEYVKLTQENWVAAGRVQERCAQPWLRHNVSNTITIHEEQQEEACRYIYDNREAFAGISIVDASGDLDYPQAPFCEVRTEDDLLKDYGTAVMFASGLIVDGLHAFGDNLWLACDTARGLGEASVLENGVPYPDEPHKLPDSIRKAYEDVHEAKRDWVRRVKQFAIRYFDNDVRKTTYCLKEVHNLKLWTDLQREYVEVDYSLMVEEKDGTKNVSLDAACAGGECAVDFA